MANNPELRVRISADLADIKQGLGLLRGELDKIKQQSARVTPGSGWAESLKSVRTQLAGILSAYAALRAVEWYADTSDQANMLTGRLRLVTKTQEEFNRAYSGTYKLAQDSQADWQSVVNLFSQLTQTTGQSQERILNLTKIIGQAFRVSGASAQETSEGLRQLQQAIAGGTLRAEEFNTIIDTAPRIVQALADHFGISFGQVRKYVNDGKISSEEFMRALEEAADSIESDFNKLPKTVQGSITQVRNALIAMVGDTNTATGASNDLAEGISSVAKTLESPGIKQGFQSFIGLLVTAAEKAIVLAAKVGDVASALREYYGELDKKSSVALRNQRDELEGKLFAAQRRSGHGLSDANDPIAKLLGLPSGKDAKIADLESQIAKIDSILDARAKAAAQPAPAASPPPSISPPAPPAAGKPAKLVAESNALQQDAVKRAIAEVERLYKASEIGTREYFATLTQLQQQAIDLQIQQARAELAVTTDKEKRIKLEEQIAILQRDRADVAKRNADLEKKANDELIDQLGQVKLKLIELDGDAGRAARLRLEAEYEKLFKRLAQESDEAGTAMVRNLVDRLVAKAQADAIASRVSAAVGGLSAQEQSIGAQMQAGLLGQAEGERRLQELRQRTLEQLREYREAAQRALESMAPGTPEYQQAVEGLAGIDTQIANVTASMRKLQMQAQDQAVNALTGFFSDLATGAKNFKEAFRDMVSSFVQGIARMAAELMARKIVMSIFGKLGLSVSPATANANGNVFDTAGIRAFARGAVFPTIAAFAAGGAFTNQVVASPTLFAFGKGGQLGVMGEAGPEAIMPLTRGPDGRLGVVAHGAGRDVTVIVENHSGAPARVEEGTAGDGSRLVKVIVDAAVGEVNRQIAGMGSTGRAISSRFGLAPAGVTRG